jgi:hypothetical protein
MSHLEIQRDFLLSVVISLDTLAKAKKLTNENVEEVTVLALNRYAQMKSAQALDGDKKT